MAMLSVSAGLMIWCATTSFNRHVFRRVVSAGAALAAGSPFLILVALQPNHAAAQQGNLFRWMVRTVNLPAVGVVEILDPAPFVWLGFALSALVLFAIVRPLARSRNLIFVSLLTGAMLVMFVPPLPGFLMRYLPHVVVRRAKYVAETTAIAGVAGGIVWLVFGKLRSRGRYAALCAAAGLGGLAMNGEQFRQWAWRSPVEHRLIGEIDDLRTLLAPIGSGRPLVAAEPDLALELAAARELSVMAPPLIHANPADAGLLGRSRDLKVLLDPVSTAQQRQEIIAREGIEWLVVRAGGSDRSSAVDWGQIGSLVKEHRGFRLFDLRENRVK
jgi:hypothetical protein